MFSCINYGILKIQLCSKPCGFGLKVGVAHEHQSREMHKPFVITRQMLAASWGEPDVAQNQQDYS